MEQLIQKQQNLFILHHKKHEKMKNILLILFLINTLFVFAEPVDTIEAKLIAINFYLSENQNKTIANVKKTIIKEYKGIKTRYTFVFEDNNFVIVSANNATVPIFAYSVSSSYGIENHPPAFEYWMQTEYDELVYYVKTNNVSNVNTIEKWNEIKNNNFSKSKASTVLPLIQTRWGQSFTNDGYCQGYNFTVDADISCNCLHCAAGCVAVAMAQIMNFWQSPDDDFDWCDMPDLLIQQDASLPYPHIRANYVTERNAIAELIADCGDKADMDYCSNNNCSSSSTIGKGKKAFKDDYNYSNDMQHRYRWLTTNWKTKMRNSLDDGQPIFYGGNKPNGGAGHAFVCDGHIGDDLFHFNWGWRGVDDGYFYIKDNDGSPVIDYYKWQEAVFYLHPEDNSTVFCIDCEKIITISNVVISNNPYNPNFPYIQWSGLPVFYNYFPVFPFPLYKPWASDIITDNGVIRLEYHNITAGTIQVDNVLIPYKVNVHLKAYDEIVLTNFETEDGAEFTAGIIPCPNGSGNKSINIGAVNDNELEFENVDDMFKREFQIFPNPCTFHTNITYNVKESEEFEISIYNIYGQKEYSLIKGIQPEGKYDITFSTDRLKDGIYICILQTNNKIETIKLIKTSD